MKNRTVTILVTAAVLLAATQIKALLNHKHLVRTFGNMENTDKDIVILLHGIYGKNTDMSHIAKRLEAQGYYGINVQYPTADDTIQVMTEKYIAPEIRKTVEKAEKINARRRENNQKELKINFVVHSMGSVVLRHYLKENRLENLGKTVFISPPTHGTHLSDIALARWLKWMLGPAVEQISTKSGSFVNSLGEPDYMCYVMIGNKTNNPLYSMIIKGKDDGMVPVSTAEIENCRFKIIEKTSHTSILKNEATLKEIIEFFEEKEEIEKGGNDGNH